MPEYRRQFSPQFKAEAVQMVIETGMVLVDDQQPAEEFPAHRGGGEDSDAGPELAGAGIVGEARALQGPRFFPVPRPAPPGHAGIAGLRSLSTGKGDNSTPGRT
jgi:hypothetical protein